MNRFQPGFRALRIEQLSERCVLSAIPIVSNFAAAAGEGENASVDKQGQIVTVIGSDNDDTIRLELGDTVHKLTVNGEQTEYNVADVNEFVIQGDAGQDSVLLLGTDKNESVEVVDRALEFKSDGYSVAVSQAEDVVVSAGGGVDRAVLFDTEGDDVLNLTPTSGELVDSTGHRFRVEGFDRVMSFATQGGHDQANFTGSAEADTFIGKAAFSFMVGMDFWNYARGYDRIDVFQESLVDDTAWLYGSTSNDTLVASAEEVVLTLSSGQVLASHGLSHTRVDMGAGNDVATMQGTSDAPDRLRWNPEVAELQTTRGTDIITTTVKGVEAANVFGGEQADTAELVGSNAADQLIALPEVVQLTTPGAAVMAHGFSRVVSRGGDGVDTAHLEDSPFNDQYVGKPSFAYLTGPGYFNLVTGFDEIDVAATNGGYDLATTHFGAAFYTIVGGQVSLPHITDENNASVQVGQFELTTTPGYRITAFTQDDLDNNRVVYVHSEDNDDPFDVDLTLRLVDALGLEITGQVTFPINKDGAGKRFELRQEHITGGIASVTGPLETNFFVLEADQHWIYGTSRNERIFGISRFRSTGPGNYDRTRIDDVPYYFGTRVNQNALLLFPDDWIPELEARDQDPVANYDLVDGVLVRVGDAFLNPPQINF